MPRTNTSPMHRGMRRPDATERVTIVRPGLVISLGGDSHAATSNRHSAGGSQYWCLRRYRSCRHDLYHHDFYDHIDIYIYNYNNHADTHWPHLHHKPGDRRLHHSAGQDNAASGTSA